MTNTKITATATGTRDGARDRAGRGRLDQQRDRQRREADAAGGRLDGGTGGVRHRRREPIHDPATTSSSATTIGQPKRAGSSSPSTAVETSGVR